MILALCASGEAWSAVIGGGPRLNAQANPPATLRVRLPEPLAAGRSGQPVVVAADLDSDGFTDLIVACETAIWSLPGPDLAPPRALLRKNRWPGASPECLSAVDLDGDGLLDLAVGFPRAVAGETPGAGRVMVLSGRTLEPLADIASPRPAPGGGFGAALAGPPSRGRSRTNGTACLLVAQPGSETLYRIRWQEGHPLIEPLGPMENHPGRSGSQDSAGIPPALVRWRSAGQDQAAVAWPTSGKVWLVPAEGVPLPIGTIGPAPLESTPGLTAGDITGDGLLDLAVVSPPASKRPGGKPAGSRLWLAPGPTYATIGLVESLALPVDTTILAGDIDGDAMLDLVASRKNHPVLLRGGRLARPVPAETGDGSTSSGRPLIVADLTADGIDEVVLAGPGASPPWRRVTLLDFSTSRAAVPYGNAHAGKAGFVPRLELDGPLQPGTLSRLRVSNATGGARALLILARDRGQASPRPGLSLLVDRPTHVRPIRLAGPNGTAGAGTLEVPLEIPDRELFVGSRLAIQCLIYDVTLEGRIASTRGLMLTIQPHPQRAAVKTMKEWRFRPDLEGRSLSFLIAKSLLLAMMLVAALVLRRGGGPWRATLALGAILLAVNVLFDLGQVGLAYNRRDALGPSALSPLFAYLAPSLRWPVLVHIALVGSALVFGARRMLESTVSARTFLTGLFLLGLAGPITLALSSPPDQVLHQFFHSGLDYSHHAPPLAEIGSFLAGYVEAMPGLSIHASTHGPGPVLWLALLEKGLGLGEMATALVLLALCAFLPLLTFSMARPLTSLRGARLAGLLVCLSPSFMLFGFVSMDGVFSLFIVACLALALSCLHARHLPIGRSLLLGLLVYLTAFQTFSIAFLAPFVIACGGLGAMRGLISRRRLVAVAALGGASFLAAHIAVIAWTGFDLVACYHTARDVIAAGMGAAKRSVSHYIFGVSGNLAAFLLAVGVPTGAMWLADIAASWKQKDWPSTIVLGASASVALLALAGVYQWEVERIWMFLVPIAAIGGARHLGRLKPAPGKMTLFLVVVWLQGVAWEVLLNTYW